MQKMSCVFEAFETIDEVLKAQEEFRQMIKDKTVTELVRNETFNGFSKEQRTKMFQVAQAFLNEMNQ